MSNAEHHMALIAPYPPELNEATNPSITVASLKLGPFTEKRAFRISGNVDFHYVASDVAGTPCTTVNQVHRTNWFPLEITIKPGVAYLNVCASTSSGKLWIAPLPPALTLSDRDS